MGRYSTVTDSQRVELWRRYKAGETVLGIATALGQRTTNLYRVLEPTGGIAPAQRKRSSRVLSFGEHFSPSSNRATNRSRSSILRHSCQGICVSCKCRKVSAMCPE
jgi:hypothetical protein